VLVIAYPAAATMLYCLVAASPGAQVDNALRATIDLQSSRYSTSSQQQQVLPGCVTGHQIKHNVSIPKELVITYLSKAWWRGTMG